MKNIYLYLVIAQMFNKLFFIYTSSYNQSHMIFVINNAKYGLRVPIYCTNYFNHEINVN